VHDLIAEACSRLDRNLTPGPSGRSTSLIDLIGTRPECSGNAPQARAAGLHRALRQTRLPLSRRHLWLLKTPRAPESLEFWDGPPYVAGMLKLERSIVSRLVCRFRSRAVVELENIALRYQLHVLRRQRPNRLQLFAIDRLLWVVLYRL
jgi:hypothetical protein